jgi:hypothetical protein
LSPSVKIILPEAADGGNSPLGSKCRIVRRNSDRVVNSLERVADNGFAND